MRLVYADLLARRIRSPRNEFPVEAPIGVEAALSVTKRIDRQSHPGRRIERAQQGLSIHAEAILEQNAAANPPRVLRVGDVLSAAQVAPSIDVEAVRDRTVLRSPVCNVPDNNPIMRQVIVTPICAACNAVFGAKFQGIDRKSTRLNSSAIPLSRM